MIEKILHAIGHSIFVAGVALSSLFGVHAPVSAPAQPVGATIPVVVATFQSSLQTSISASATSMTLVSGTDTAGNNLSGYTCFNIDEGTSIEEFVCGTASGTSITSMIRGIDPKDGDLEVTALKKAHRRGASVKITNYPSLAVVSRILNGNEKLPNPITYDTGVGPTGLSDLTDKEYVLSVVNGGTVTFDKRIEEGNAGETIAAGNIVYLKASDSRWWKASASAASTSENVVLGIAQGAGTAGNPISGGVLRSGVDATHSGLTANTVYYLSDTAGAVATSAGTKSVVVGIATSTTTLAFEPRYTTQLTTDLSNALAGGGAYGTPSSSNKFITQSYNSSSTGIPTKQTFTAASTTRGGDTTQFDITNPSGTTFRYTYDGNGTDPGITSGTFPVGTVVLIASAAPMATGNQGSFIVTGSGTNYFEVTNASGTVESNKTLLNGYLKTMNAQTYTAPANLKYAVVEVQGAGAAGMNTGTNEARGMRGGGAGAYAKKILSAATIGASQTLYVGVGGINGYNINIDYPWSGSMSTFGSLVKAPGGSGSSGGVSTDGDINIPGGSGGSQDPRGGTGTQVSGKGGDAFFGFGGASVASDSGGNQGNGYGGGGSGAAGDSSSSPQSGGSGENGIITVTEYYQ